MGHVRSYVLADVYARFRRATGDGVLFSLGFDAFGLPSEASALERGMSPRRWVESCRIRMADQFDRLGLSVDWARTFATSDETMYRWSQWLFLLLLERGLVYRAPAEVDWCDGCQTVLANIQVDEGRCWRCQRSVRVRMLDQWHLRVTAYADEADRRLPDLHGWNKTAIAGQRALVGAVEGVELEAIDTANAKRLTVFSRYPSRVNGGTFVALSARHPEVLSWAEGELADVIRAMRSAQRNRAARRAEATSALDTGRRVRIAGVPRELPVVITPAVDARFGPTAALGHPDVDKTDARVSECLGLPAEPCDVSRAAVRVASATRRRLRDFVLSRQRPWGAPIPVVHCPSCGVVPVDADALPVRVPDDLFVDGEVRRLAEHPTFALCTCPRCGGEARRETDTLDCHFDPLWCWMGHCVPSDDRQHELFTHPEIRRWLPIDFAVYGVDGASYLYDARVVTKALRDADVLPELDDGEPFAGVLVHEMVRMGGRKMSKHLGNVADPDRLVEEYGADALRLAVVFAAAPTRAFDWTHEPLDLCRGFIERVWRYCQARAALVRNTGPVTAIDTGSPRRRRLAIWCATATRRVTDNLETMQAHKVARDVMRLLERLELFEELAGQASGGLDERDHEAIAYGIRVFLRLLAPLAPHVAEELWSACGGEGLIAFATWPGIEALEGGDAPERTAAVTQ